MEKGGGKGSVSTSFSFYFYEKKENITPLFIYPSLTNQNDLYKARGQDLNFTLFYYNKTHIENYLH